MGSVNTDAVIVDAGGSPDSLFAGAEKLNAHWHEYDAVKATNRTGAQRVAGDVVAWDPANDVSVVADNTAISLRSFGVVAATIANAAAGEVVRSGLCVAKAQGTIARGEYVRKSATAWCVESAGASDGAAPPEGTIGVARTAAAGGVVTILLYGFTVIGRATLARAAPTQVVNNVANSTVTETLLTLTIPANRLTAGRALRVKVAGLLTSTAILSGSPQVSLVGVLGATTLLSTSYQPASTPGAAHPWMLDGLITATASNAQQGYTIAVQVGNVIASAPRATASEDATADLTLTVQVSLFVDSGSTGGVTFDLDHLSVEIV